MNWYNYIFPEVQKKWLFILAGVMWLGVAILLNAFAVSWLAHYEMLMEVVIAAVGVIAAVLIYKFGFLRIALKNIKRIHALEELNNILHFQEKMSYVIVPVMIAMGIILRHSPIPKNLLAIVYIGIGDGLLFSSFHYFFTLQHIETSIINTTAD